MLLELEEEAKKEEEKVVGKVRTIPDLKTLKQIIRGSFAEFEKALDELPSDEREEFWRIYLNKIRKTTFGFHLALIRHNARKAYAENPSPETMGRMLGKSAGQMQRIGRTYRFL